MSPPKPGVRGLAEAARERVAALAGDVRDRVSSPPSRPSAASGEPRSPSASSRSSSCSSSRASPCSTPRRPAAVTPNHEDVRATGAQSRADGALVLPEWASSLNLTGPVTLDIRLGDLDAASADLEAYLRSGRSLNGLVFRLDMTDTDVDAFRQNNTANMASLERLLNQSEEFGRLGALELQYRDSKDAAMLKSVQLQGEELRKAVGQNYQSYAARQAGIVNLSQQYGLDTSAYEQSVLDFAAIAAAIGAVQDDRAASVPEAIREIQQGAANLPPITFEVVPDTGGYGDVLSLQGTVRAPAGTAVTLFADGRPLAGVVSGADGRFAFPYRVERIDTGSHAAYASAGAAISDERNFTVDERNTTIDLVVGPLFQENGYWAALCTGNLVDRGRRARPRRGRGDRRRRLVVGRGRHGRERVVRDQRDLPRARPAQPDRVLLPRRPAPELVRGRPRSRSWCRRSWTGSHPSSTCSASAARASGPCSTCGGGARRRRRRPARPAARPPSPWSSSRPRRPSRRPPGPRPCSRPGSTGARPSPASTGGSCASSTSATRARPSSRSRRASSRPGSPDGSSTASSGSTSGSATPGTRRQKKISGWCAKLSFT